MECYCGLTRNAVILSGFIGFLLDFYLEGETRACVLHFIQSELYFCAPDFYPEVVLYWGYADGVAEESGVDNGVMADWFLKGGRIGSMGGFGGMGCFAGEGVCLIYLSVLGGCRRWVNGC